MPTRTAVKTDKAPPPLPFYSQAIICNGMVYCSGSIGMSPDTKALIEGGIADRTVSCALAFPPWAFSDIITSITNTHTTQPHKDTMSKKPFSSTRRSRQLAAELRQGQCVFNRYDQFRRHEQGLRKLLQ